MSIYLTDLADVLRKAGLEVVEIPGWKTRGRPGAFNPKGVLCHHTAGGGDGLADATYMAKVGRPDLSAPLAQLALSRKGVWYVLAAGRANHAGRCKAIGGLKPYPGVTYGDGNEQMIGIEAQNRGTNAEGWGPVQYGAYVAGVAAITRRYGWSIIFGHKETSTSGKVDPDFPMDKFRRDVAAHTPTTPAGGFLMALTDKQQADLYNRVMGSIPPARIKTTTNPDGSPVWLLTSADGNTLANRIATAAVDPAALAGALAAALPQGGAVTDAQLEAALRKVLGSVDNEPTP